MKRFTLSLILLLPVLARANQEWFFADNLEPTSMGMEGVWLMGMYATVVFIGLAVRVLVSKDVLLPQKRSVRVLWSLGYAGCAGLCWLYPVAGGIFAGVFMTVLIILLSAPRR